MRSSRQSLFSHYFHLYAVKDRVDLRALSDNPPSSPSIKSDEVCKMPLPIEKDSKSVHEYFSTHVARILVKNLPAKKLAFDDLVDWHIQHPHSWELRYKWEVINRYPMSLLVSLEYCIVHHCSIVYMVVFMWIYFPVHWTLMCAGHCHFQSFSLICDVQCHGNIF